jgi:ribosome biogenesis GTPase A
MAKSKRLLTEQVKSVDAVIEICDARAPRATRNPDLDALCAHKQRLLILNKADLADDRETARWLDYFERANVRAIRMNCIGSRAGEALKQIERMTRPAVERMKAKGVNKTVRLMVVGIPNVGKSTFINRLKGHAIARASDRPGVTRANQWVKVGQYLELLDTPGMLWPKLEDQRAARTLAFIGSIRDDIMDAEALSGKLLETLMKIDEAAARARFKLAASPSAAPGHALIEEVCIGRGFLLSGARPDIARAAAIVLDEFRAGRVGKISLETAPA